MSWLSDRLYDKLVEIPWWAHCILTASLGGFAVFGIHFRPLFGPYAVFLGILILYAGMAAMLTLTGAIVGYMRAKQGKRLLEGPVTLNEIKAMGWSEFEDFIGEMFRAHQCEVWRGPSGQPDGGVDWHARRDGERYVIQCKQMQRDVDVAKVRELLGVVLVENVKHGFLISTRGFSRPALDLAKRTDRVILIDGAKLTRICRRLDRERKAAKAPAETVTLSLEQDQEAA